MRLRKKMKSKFKTCSLFEECQLLQNFGAYANNLKNSNKIKRKRNNHHLTKQTDKLKKKKESTRHLVREAIVIYLNDCL